MKKRIAAMLLVICLVLSAVPVYAGAATGQKVTANNVTVTAGNTVTVTLTAENFESIAALDVDVYYDPEVFTVSSTANGSLLSGAQASVNTAEAGKITLSLMSLNGIRGTGSLLTIRFATKTGATPDSYPITVAIGRAYDSGLQPATVAGVSGSIQVNKPSETVYFNLSSGISSSTVRKDDVVTYYVYNNGSRSFVSGSFTMTYDYELFAFEAAELSTGLTGEGAVYSVNSSVLGQVRIAYANDKPISSYSLFTVKLRVLQDTDTTTTLKAEASNMYREDLSMYLPGSTSYTVRLQKQPEVIDYPNAWLETEYLQVGQQAQSVFSLEAGANVAAADFTLSYDPSVLRCASVTMAEAVQEIGGMLILNDNFAEGKIRFSYVNMDAYEGELPLVNILWEPISSPQNHYQVIPSGVGVVDENQNPVTLEYVTDTGCIMVRTVVDPTCTEDGYTEFACGCGESYQTDPTQKLGHNVIENPAKAPTCTEIGWEAYYACSRCNESDEFVAIPALGHSLIQNPAKEPDCTEIGWEAYDTCARCDYSTYQELLPLGHRVITEVTKLVKPVEMQILKDFELINGTYYSKNHAHYSQSEMTVTALYDCTVTLNYGVSSEQNFDKLWIYKNSVQLDMISGSYSGKTKTLSLNAGDVLTFKYTKDGSVNTNADQGWVTVSYQNVWATVVDEVQADTVEPDCTNAVICDDCGAVVKTALGHTPAENGTCTGCGEVLAALDGIYLPFAEAVTKAVSGQTVHLIADTVAEDVILQPGATLDLSGYTLTANSVMTYSSSTIADTSEAVAGLLKLRNADGNLISRDNPSLPVYDNVNGGYRFFAVTVTAVAVTGKRTGNIKYWFKTEVENFEQFNVLLQTGAEVFFQVKMTWDGQDEAVYATANLDFTKKWAEKKLTYITVTVEGSEELENFTLTPGITAGGFEISGEEMK